MPSAKLSFRENFATFSPLWFYIILYKFGAGIHYSMIAVLGSQVLPLWAVGLAVSYASLIELLCDIPAGFILEKYGYLRMLRITTVLFICAGGILLFGLTPLTYFLSITLGAFGWLFFTPGINAYLLAHSPVPIFGRLYGVMRASEGSGIMIATLGLPFFVHLPVQTLGLIIIYPLIGALTALMVGNHYHMPNTLPPVTTTKRQAFRAGLQEIRASFHHLHPAGTILGIYTLSIASFYGVVWFIFPLLIEAGTTPRILSASMTMLEFAMIIAGFTIARFADSTNKKVLILAGLGVVSVMSALLGLTFHPILIAICFALSFGDELLRTTLWAWLDAKADKNQHHGVVTGVINFLEDAGWMIGPTAAGFLLATVGASATLRIGGLIVLLSAGIAVALVLLPTARTNQKHR